jgi:hypothetical protein
MDAMETTVSMDAVDTVGSDAGAAVAKSSEPEAVASVSGADAAAAANTAEKDAPGAAKEDDHGDTASDQGAGEGEDGDDESESEEDVYEVANILDARESADGSTEYLIKWKGWGAQHNSWEPREHIMDEELIGAFEQRRAAKQKKAASPRPKGRPAGSGTPGGRSMDGAESGGGGGGGAPAAEAEAVAVTRDEALLAEFTGEWLPKYTQKAIAKAGNIGLNSLSHWVNNRIESAVTMRSVEGKLSSFLATAKAALAEGGEEAERRLGLPPARKEPPPRMRDGAAEGDGGGSSTKHSGGKRPRKSAAAIRAEEAEAAAKARAAKAAANAAKRAEAEAAAEAALVDADELEDEESDGEGDHHIESLLCCREFVEKGLKQTSVLVKWAAFSHSENTWEAQKNLHEEVGSSRCPRDASPPESLPPPHTHTPPPRLMSLSHPMIPPDDRLCSSTGGRGVQMEGVIAICTL